MSGIDISITLFKIINVPAVTTLLGGGKVYRFNRPINSNKPDVVIATSNDLTEVYVNVHVPNLKLEGDQTTPDLAKMQSITNAIVPLISSVAGLSIKSVGVPIRDNDGHWFAQTTLSYAIQSPSDRVSVTYYELNSTEDGYGGVTVSRSSVWTGTATITKRYGGDKRSSSAGVTTINAEVDFLSERVPQKDYQIDTTEGTYVIRGISRQNGLWLINAVRKDAPYV